MSDEELDKAFFNEDPYFESLIGRDEDTTMRNSTHCAYDKIITTEGLTDMVVERDTKVFNLRRVEFIRRGRSSDSGIFGSSRVQVTG